MSDDVPHGVTVLSVATRLALVAATALALSGCSGGIGGMPIYLGDDLVGRVPGGPAQAGAAATTPASDCQRLAARVADTSLNSFQRQAAADYGASLGC